MNINDIPLPATPSKKINLFGVSKIIDNKDNHGSFNRILPLKRHVNKLPVGVIQKSDDSKVNNHQRKELFLPTMNDKIQLAMSNFNPVQSKTLEMLLNATKFKPLELNNNEIKIDDEKRAESKSDNRKRRLHDEIKESKKSKIEVRIDIEEKPHRHKLNNHTSQVTMKSQVIVKQNLNILESNRNRSRHDNDYDISNDDKKNRKRNKSNLSPNYRGYRHYHHHYEYSHHSYTNEDNGPHKKYRSFVAPNFHSNRVDYKNNHNYKTSNNHHYSHNTLRNEYSRSRKRSRSSHNIMKEKNNYPRYKNDIDISMELPKLKQQKDERHSQLPQIIRASPVKHKKSISSITNSSSSSSSISSSSSSASKISMSSSNEDSIELPLISPKSPDEDNSRLMDGISEDRVLVTTTAMANDCLKELSATLVKMNMAYQSK